MKIRLKIISKTITLIGVLLLSTFTVNAANYYWVGDAGSWSDMAHWSNASGGTGSAYTVVPGASDNVYFDDNSFSLTLQTVQIDVDGVCNDMDWTGATGNPIFVNGGTNTNLMFHGSLILIPQLRWLYVGAITSFVASDLGNEINAAGHTLQGLVVLATVGDYELTGNLNVNSFNLEQGKLITNNFDVIVNAEFSFGSSSSVRVLDLGDSEVFLSSNAFIDLQPSAGTASVTSNNANIIVQGNNQINNVSDFNLLSISNGATVTFTGGSSINAVVINAGGTLALDNNASYVVNSLITNGSELSPVTLTTSNIGSLLEPNLSLTNPFCGNYINVNGISSTGALAETGADYTDSGVNAGWSFGTCAPTIANFSSSNSIACEGSSLTFKNLSTGGVPSFIFWDFGDGNTSTVDPIVNHAFASSGAYTVTLYAGSSSFSTTIFVQQAQTIDAGPDQIICSTSDALLEGVMGGSTTGATWINGNGNYSPDNSTLDATYTPSTPEINVGTVTLTLESFSVSSTCPPVTDQVTITIDVCSGLNDQLENRVFSVYPTHTNGLLTIDGQTTSSEKLIYSVFDVIGNNVAQGITNSSIVNLSELNSGQYIIQLTSGNVVERHSIQIAK